ncbi:aminotransferase class I/II-fold pyridoxal phosphate-dependent enzyme [Periweissella cryptocerci]|uniref:Aminotransferase n=1 Tax=Periweissella cryptocerci TaxID=2506420 RepID=A0A4P6YW97_9LACO|nr:aminotransferase class I/II-fold pyridoxal phosphate-dependent enzyme [Periweissella cryptocerci]QBO37056.1 aminotransferase class I/II-fold pyridoxal phosphate-dependent enzyme [Periweissella cryptocerci]
MPQLKTNLINQINQYLPQMKPSAIRAFDEEVSSIPDILKLTLGEPDFNVPAEIKAAGIQSIENDDSHYAASRGTVDLRQAIADFLARKYQVSYNPATEVVVTIGATEAIYDVIGTVINPGDEVLIPTPTFPLYEAVVAVNGGVPVFINTQPDDFILTPARLAATLAEHPTAKMLVLNFPSNPTGVTYSETELADLAAVIKQHDLFVLSDEIYSELAYDAAHTSIAKLLPEQTILINGASKAYAMTGYRIGFLTGPAELVTEIAKLHQFVVTTPINSSMAAAAKAFADGDDDIAEMKQAYQNRRDYLMKELSTLGFGVAKPEGAFYLFVKIPAQFGSDDEAFARQLAHEGKLALVPGHVFGAGGEGYVRLSYAASLEHLQLAVARLTAFIKG